MKDHKDTQPKVETKTFMEKLETATPTQVAQSIIAQVVQKIKHTKLQAD